MTKFGFVYCWTNIKNGMKYIGSHHGKEDDGYIGSGFYFRRAYDKSPQNFIREILEYNTVIDDPYYTRALEQKYFDAITDIHLNENYYNLSNNAKNCGGWNKGLTKETHPTLARSTEVKEKLAMFISNSHKSGNRIHIYKLISASKLGKTKDNDEGRRITAKKLLGNTNSKNTKNKPLGKIHIHNNGERKMIFPEDIDRYPGWQKGRGKLK